VFRGIGGIIRNKSKNFIQDNNNNKKLILAFSMFLNECFPEAKNLHFDISIFGNKITIQTTSKTVANELILKANDMSIIFRKENIAFQQIIIR